MKSQVLWRKAPHIALIAAVIGIVIAVVVPHHAGDGPESGLAPDALSMRGAPAPWFAQERDISVLDAELRGGKVRTVGFAEDAILVTNDDGIRYFVADAGRGRIAELVLSSYRSDSAARFTTITLDGVRRPSATLGGTAGRILESATRGLAALLPFVLLVGAAVVYRRGGFGEFRLAARPAIRFSDVIGAAEAKSAVADILAYLRDPAAFAALGARPPRGVLMVGPPGTGKTRLAQALAGEAAVNFICASGSDFSSKFFGMGPQRVKSLFKQARRHAPCIVFIDEIDGIGRRTTGGHGPAEAESNRIINQLLVEMDGFEPGAGVIVVGATNLAEMLDAAMLREGRFDRRVHVRLPDVADRADILRLHAAGVRCGHDVDFQQLARMTTGLTPAALAAIVNHAALLAARAGLQRAEMHHLVEAIEVSQMGEPNGSVRALTEAERERVAVHEAGHALIAQALGVGQLEKVTIVPRGGALGVTLVTEPQDKHLRLRSELEHRILMLLGGRSAEIMCFGEASSGAVQDLKEASRIALAMVGQYGLGPSGSLFSLDALENDLAAAHATEHAVNEARGLLASLEARCLATLAELRPALDAVALALQERETIDGPDVAAAIRAARTPARALHVA